MRPRLAALALVLAACGGKSSYVVLTVDNSGAQVAVTRIDVKVTSGADTANVSFSDGNPFTIRPARSMALKFDAARTGTVDLEVTAVGAGVGAIKRSATLSSGSTVRIDVDLAVPVLADLATSNVSDGGDLAMSLPDGVAPVDAVALTDQSALPADATMTAADLSMNDLLVPDLKSLPDLVGADLRSCTLSTDCPDTVPICRGTALCDVCSSAADDNSCLSRSPATPRCALTGPNAGRCVTCRSNLQCPSLTPFCTATNTCRKCAKHGECASLVCNPDGTCATPNATFTYVDNRDQGLTACMATFPTQDGSQANPYCDLPTAISASATGSTVILVGRTTPYEPATIVKTLTLLGPGIGSMPPAIIAPNLTNAIIVNPSMPQVVVTISGFEIGDPTQKVMVSGIRCLSGQLVATDLLVRNATQHGLSAEGNCFKFTVDRVVVTNTATGINFSTTMLASYSITNTISVRSTSAGFRFSGTNGNGIFAFNTAAANPVGISCDAGFSRTFNSTIVANNTQNLSGGCPITFTSSVADSFLTGVGNLNADPQFLDPTTGDFRIRTTSPAVDLVPKTNPDAGFGVLPDHDYLNAPRPLGVGYDVGAHEAK